MSLQALCEWHTDPTSGRAGNPRAQLGPSARVEERKEGKQGRAAAPTCCQEPWQGLWTHRLGEGLRR